jgi:HK97 family phage prohead protease
MPYPNEHSARLQNPGKFDEDTFRRTNGGTIFGHIKVPKTIAIIWGKLKERNKPSDFPIPQALRFPIKNWDVVAAKKWLKDNDIKFISFEEAAGKFMIDEENTIGEIEYKSFPLEIFSCEQKDKEGQKFGIFTGAMATEDVDRGNEIIAADAFDKSLDRYRKSKRAIRLFYQHNTSELPIGIIPIESVSKEGNRWNIKGELNLDTQRGRDVYALMKQGALTDLSIGYSILDSVFDKGLKILKEIELWETSVVTEPMNEKAIIDGVKAATSFKDLPLADRGTAWDKTEANDRVRKFTGSEDNPSAKYRNAFLWFDSDNADNFTAYKLPYADVIDGKLTAVPRAIFAAAQVLRGARAGVDIPEADKGKVITHINRYYKKMGLSSPFEKDFYDYEDALEIKNKRDFENALRDSGLFSKKASIYLASFFNTEVKQSDSANVEEIKEGHQEILKKLDEFNCYIKKLCEGK